MGKMKILLILYGLYVTLCINRFKSSKILHYIQILFMCLYVNSSPVTGLEWPRGFQEVKVPRILDNGTGRWLGYQPYAPAAFTPKKFSWYSFLSEAESTPGP